MELRLKNARISHAQGLWTKSSAVENGTKKFNCDFISGPTTVVERKNAEGKWVVVPGGLQEAERMVATDAWKGNVAKAQAWHGALALKQQRAVREGDKTKLKADGEAADGYAGAWFVHATSDKQMPTFDAQGREETGGKDASSIYSGCYVTARVSLYANLKPGQHGIFASLQGTQFTGDGDAFGGGTRASKDDFEPAEGADAGDFGPAADAAAVDANAWA
jgi:hypothetical protein